MVKRKRDSIIEWFHTADPVVLLSLPFLLCGGLVIFLLLTLPFAGTLRYFFFFAYFAATLFSRMCRTWESGIEVYHVLTFCFAFTFGPIPGLIFWFATTVPTMLGVFVNKSLFFNYLFPGTVFQTIDLFVLTIVAGLLGILAPIFTATHLATVGISVVSVTFLIEKLVCNRVVGLDWGRLLTGYFIGLALGYNVFLFFGLQILQLLAQFA